MYLLKICNDFAEYLSDFSTIRQIYLVSRGFVLAQLLSELFGCIQIQINNNRMTAAFYHAGYDCFADAARTARHNNVLSCEIHTYFPFRFCIVFIVFVFNFSFLNL